MKKKLLMLLTLACMVCLTAAVMVGCSSGNEEKSEEALREKLTQLEQAQDSSEAVLHDGQHVPLRFSMGCCFIDEVAAPYDEMLEKADIAMYQNKRQRKEKHGKQPRRKE